MKPGDIYKSPDGALKLYIGEWEWMGTFDNKVHKPLCFWIGDTSPDQPGRRTYAECNADDPRTEVLFNICDMVKECGYE